MAPRHERRLPDFLATALAVLNTQALSLPALALLFAGAAGTALVLAQALREVRAVEWAPALGWGLGGSFAVGTGIWALQLALWHAAQQPTVAWFAAAPLVAGWALAVGGSALVLAGARWLPPRAPIDMITVALTATLLSLVFVLLGDAMAVPPQWQALAAWLAIAALGTTAAGLWYALRWLQVPPASAWPGWPCIGGAGLFALTWLIGEWLGLVATTQPVSPATATAAGSLPLAMPSDAVDARLVLLALGFGGLVLVVALIAAMIDSRSGRRVRWLANSLHDANQRLLRLSSQDVLTGLPNRAHFEQRLNRLDDDAGARPSAMAVLFIDIDGFKAINESFGHAAGDRVLQVIGQRLSALARPQDMAARIGGDEFVLLVIAPGSHEAAAAVAQRTLRTLVAPYALPDGSA
jgi:diguanylate cyclase (GGDEF)-like protein